MMRHTRTHIDHRPALISPPHTHTHPTTTHPTQSRTHTKSKSASRLSICTQKDQRAWARNVREKERAIAMRDRKKSTVGYRILLHSMGRESIAMLCVGVCPDPAPYHPGGLPTTCPPDSREVALDPRVAGNVPEDALDHPGWPSASQRTHLTTPGGQVRPLGRTWPPRVVKCVLWNIPGHPGLRVISKESGG